VLHAAPSIDSLSYSDANGGASSIDRTPLPVPDLAGTTQRLHLPHIIWRNAPFEGSISLFASACVSFCLSFVTPIMALIRRYGLYTLLAVVFVYVLYNLSFPYETDDPNAKPNHPANDAGAQRPGQQQQLPNHKSIDWSRKAIHHPVKSFVQLPTGTPAKLPKIQFDFPEEDATARNIRETRREEVRKQFLKCWTSYRQMAWMHDELRPISGEVNDHFGGWAATLIDALDTLWIMDFKEEFESAIKDVERIDFGYTTLSKVNVFETNIRHLGGLLAAYELSGERRLLNKAKEVGEMLYHAFDTPNHMPVTRWDFRAAGEGKQQLADPQVLLAEIGSMTMEFTRLSQLTGDPKWYDAVTRVSKELEKQQDITHLPGMWPIVVNGRKLDFAEDNTFTLSSMADSTYEYLGKMHALLGGQDPIYKRMYEKAMATAIKHILYRPMTSDDSDMLASGAARVEGSTVFLDPELQHLGCYTGGMFALGGRLFGNPEHVDIGRKLTDTCVWAYKSNPAGIMPEVAHLVKCANTTECHWDDKAWHAEVTARADLQREADPLRNIAGLRLPPGFSSIEDRRYILRPEAIESVFVLYRITGEQSWQAAGWDMWTSIMRVTDTDIGNAALLDISADTPPMSDSMEVSWQFPNKNVYVLTTIAELLDGRDPQVFLPSVQRSKLDQPGRLRLQHRSTSFSASKGQAVDDS
jgi:mannosyl-oligosaccharide alpha-1,2-mannosidase